MENASMEELQRMHKSAKTKMILGIVFLAVGGVITMIASLVYLAEVAATFANFTLSFADEYFTATLVYLAVLFLAVPLECVGTPFLIIGIIGTVKSNKRINALRAQSDFT